MRLALFHAPSVSTLNPRKRQGSPFLAPLVLTAGAALASAADRPAVRYLPESKLFVLETERTSYVLGVNEQNEVQLAYWGARLQRDADLDPVRTRAGYAFESEAGQSEIEYPGWGGLRFAEPCLKVTFADGVRDLVLKYVSHEVQGDRLVLHLKDIEYDLGVDLVYRVFPRHDIVEKQATIRNGTNGAVMVESAHRASGTCPTGCRRPHVPPDAPRRPLGGETQMIREPIEPGMKVLESRRGNTSHQANPWFAIDEDGRADEEHGEVWFGALAWSGNWRIAVEHTPEGRSASPAASTTSTSPTGSSPASRSRRRRSTAASRSTASARPRACSTASDGRVLPTAPRASCGPCSTTPGKPPSSTSTRRARRRSPRRPRASASSSS